MGYHQVEVHPDDREKKAFSTPFGFCSVQCDAVRTCHCICDVHASNDSSVQLNAVHYLLGISGRHYHIWTLV